MVVLKIQASIHGSGALLIIWSQENLSDQGTAA